MRSADVSFLHKISRLAEQLELAVLASGLLFCSLLLFANVMARYLFRSPFFWAEELVRYCMVWMIFLGAALVARRGGHIAVNILPQALSPEKRTFLALGVAAGCTVFCLALTWFGLMHTLAVRASGQVSTALEIPIWWVYLSVPTGGTLMSLHWMSSLWAGGSRLWRERP